MKKILISLFFIFCSYSSFSTHFMGGEITWICIKGGPDIGKYIFEMKVYRDCSGSALSATSATITHHNYPALGQTAPILMNFISLNDISPQGTNAFGNACYDCAAGNLGAVEEGLWRSDPIVLLGSPPTEGWHFTYSNFARNDAVINIANPGGLGFTLRAIMYPYSILGIVQNADPCFDSSPAFKEQSKTIICIGYPFSYSHNATDDEFDKLTYAWADPLDNYSTPYIADTSNVAGVIPYAPNPPYSLTTPLPGSPTLDFETGQVSYFSNTSGSFVTCIKVKARKCGQLISEIYREVQVTLVDCNTNPPIGGFNAPPTITPPFPLSATPFEKDVYAGDLVTFNIQAEDNDIYPGGVPQEVFMDVSGGEFAADFINTNLCPNPPCATFNNGAGLTPPFSAPTIVNGVFEWQAHCAHLTDNCGNGSTSSLFTFSIKAYDDFCPANGLTFATITITVFPPLPDFRCVSVADNGDIELTWKYIDNSPPTNEPVFIWHSTNFVGPYTIIDSSFFPINTYTHVGANGDNAIQYYYLSNSEGCDPNTGPEHSDTLQSIFMDVTPINFGVAASLNWNAIRDPLLLTSATDYDLYLKRSPGLFTNYLTTPLLAHQYDAISCNDDIESYVEIPDESGCVSKSSIGVANLLDSITPIIPIITDISVDASGKSVISWIPSPGADMYIIYLQGTQGDVTIDTVWGELSDSYTYNLSLANQDYETFSIRALDSCSNTKNTTPYHNSIYLEADLDACTHNLTLNWNEYINWDANVSYYSLVVEETDLSNFTTVIDTNLQNITNYVISNLKDKFSYKIYIVARDGDTIFTAISNQLVLIPNLPKKPDFNYIEYVSVNHDNDFVEINCLVDNTAIIHHYDVMRSLRVDNNFIKIGEVPFSGTTTIHYTDEEAKTSENFYQYQIYPVDTCGIRLSAPPINMAEYLNDTSFAQTILLETVINLDYSDEGLYPNEYTNTLNFNEYDKWLGDVSEYRLYRSINRQPFNLLPICTWDRLNEPNEPLQFIDVVTEYGDGNGRFCYYIEALEGNATPYGPVLEGSFSNISCVSQTPIIFIPSVFTPNGDEHNEVFHPVTYYVSEKGYSFTIYSRSGEKIFTTNNPLKGWDGTFNGNIVQDGNYVYHLQYINGVGDLIEKTEMITLVR